MDSNEKKIVNYAVKALLYELVVNPKPALVDPTGNETHPDMNVFTFINSTLALEDYFHAVYQAGAAFSGTDLRDLFQQIRPLGVAAEREMYQATKGVNTHKGAIFSLGVLVAASGFSGSDLQAIVTTAKAMLWQVTENDFAQLQEKSELTAGERQFLKYGLKGIRGEAEAGFPSVTDFALPFFQATKGTLNQRLLDTLLKIASVLDDSSLIKRAGSPEILSWLHSEIAQFFELGGSASPAGFQKLLQINQKMNQDNLSLGGTADILILTIFFVFINGDLTEENVI